MPSLKKKYIPLIFVMIVFIVPAIVGTLLYHFHDYFNFKTTNRGTLLTPPMQVQYLYSGLEDGDQKKWRIIHVSGGECAAECQKINFQLGQVQKALGKNHNRVALVFIDGQYQPLKKFQEEFAQQINSNPSATRKSITNKGVPVSNNEIYYKIYLVDPLGNLFMYYPETTDPMNILKDLKKVLEVSQIG